MTDAIDFYTRPGCIFSMSLRRSLRRAGVPIEEHDIWQDADAAEFVRDVTGGNETVPTLRIGPVALVNPSTGDVLAAVEKHTPDLLPPDWEPPRPGLLTRLLGRFGTG